MAEIRRISTGIEGLDAIVGGGFIKDKVYLVSGESGTGKTVMGLQFLAKGLQLGESAIYISGDEKPSHLLVDAESLGWDFTDYFKKDRLGLLDVAPYFRDIYKGAGKAVDVRTIVADLTKHVKRIGAKRLVIDPIAPIVFTNDNVMVIREYIRELVFAMEDNLGCTVIITSGIPNGTQALSRYGVAEFVTEGVIVLGMRQCTGRHVRTLFIRKMRSTPTDLEDHMFDIVAGKGIVIVEGSCNS